MIAFEDNLQNIVYVKMCVEICFSIYLIKYFLPSQFFYFCFRDNVKSDPSPKRKRDVSSSDVFNIEFPKNTNPINSMSPVIKNEGKQIALKYVVHCIFLRSTT